MRIWLIGLLLLCTACAAPPPSDPSNPFARASRIYQMRCRTCHQADGSGTIRGNRFAADFTLSEGVLSKPDAALLAVISDGMEGQYGRMPAFKPILSEQEMGEVLAYIRATFGAAGREVEDGQVPTSTE